MILIRIWKDQPGSFFCISTKDRKGTWKDHFFRRSQFKEIPGFIEENLDKDLYWCPHGFNKPRRLKKHAEIPKLLWADLDEIDPRDLDDLMPSVAWESSPGRFAAVWVLGNFMTEDLNRRLTYHLKADPGGWDLTQVLRIPNTTNYKYTSTPRTRLLWSDGPSYTSGQITRHLPKERVERQHDVARGVYRKYEKDLSGWVRRELLRGKPKKGKRSEVLWKLTNELIEAGLSSDEAFELLRVSPWNKFTNRRDGDEQLRREIDKALGQHIAVEDDEDDREPYGTGFEEEDDEPYVFLGRSMKEVEEENIDWIWYPYLARGEVTILEGDPGLGKSYLAQMVAKDICDGRRLPAVKKLKPVQGKVAYFDIENASATVTKKRLLCNDMQHLENFYQEEEPFTVEDDETLDIVYEAIDKLRPTLCVFDTLNTYIGGGKDTHKASDVQAVFKRFVEIARRFNCSVLVLRHLTKSSKERALYRGQGSIAFSGLARVVLTVGQSPDDPDTRVMAVTKINVTRPPRALTFTIESLPDTLRESDRSRFVWGDFVDFTSDEIIVNAAVGSDSKREAQRELMDAEAFVLGVLSEGPVEKKKVERAAEARSISKTVLAKAAKALGVVKEKRGFGRKAAWLWGLPGVGD